MIARSRSGKGAGIVIPNLLDFQESMVVLDIKQENFDLTSGSPGRGGYRGAGVEGPLRVGAV